ncbi:MAG: EamA family transporter [Candidatus Pacebacteria bacterium]|nr:EamA family transporter [Candidatus Paceibacterota bacterium]
MAKKRNSRLQSYFFLLINTIVWGAALIVVKPALEYTTPFRYMLYRYLIATIAAIPIILLILKNISKKQLKKVKLKQIILLEALGSGLALAALYSGLKFTSALEANLLTTTVPIFVTLGGIFLLKEKQERNEWIGLIIAFIGTLILTLAPIFSLNGQFTQFSIWGNLLILLHNIINLFYFPLAKRVYQGAPKLLISGISFYIGLVFFIPLVMFELGSPNPMTLINTMISELQNFSVLWAAFYMAIFGSIIGLTAYIKGQEGIEASEASLFWYLQPLIYIPLGYIMLNEKINTIQVVSLLVIFIGVFIAEKRNSRKKI